MNQLHFYMHLLLWKESMSLFSIHRDESLWSPKSDLQLIYAYKKNSIFLNKNPSMAWKLIANSMNMDSQACEEYFQKTYAPISSYLLKFKEISIENVGTYRVLTKIALPFQWTLERKILLCYLGLVFDKNWDIILNHMKETFPDEEIQLLSLSEEFEKEYNKRSNLNHWTCIQDAILLILTEIRSYWNKSDYYEREDTIEDDLLKFPFFPCRNIITVQRRYELIKSFRKPLINNLDSLFKTLERLFNIPTLSFSMMMEQSRIEQEETVLQTKKRKRTDSDNVKKAKAKVSPPKPWTEEEVRVLKSKKPDMSLPKFYRDVFIKEFPNTERTQISLQAKFQNMRLKKRKKTGN